MALVCVTTSAIIVSGMSLSTGRSIQVPHLLTQRCGVTPSCTSNWPLPRTASTIVSLIPVIGLRLKATPEMTGSAISWMMTAILTCCGSRPSFSR